MEKGKRQSCQKLGSQQRRKLHNIAILARFPSQQTLRLPHMLRQDAGRGVGPSEEQGQVVRDPVLDFKLDLHDETVKMAWESTQVLIYIKVL